MNTACFGSVILRGADSRWVDSVARSSPHRSINHSIFQIFARETEEERVSAQARTGLAVCCFTRAWENHECWWPTWRYWMRVDAAALQRYLLFPTRLLQVLRLLATPRVSQIPFFCLCTFSHLAVHQELDNISRKLDPTPFLPDTQSLRQHPRKRA